MLDEQNQEENKHNCNEGNLQEMNRLASKRKSNFNRFHFWNYSDENQIKTIMWMMCNFYVWLWSFFTFSMQVPYCTVQHAFHADYI